MKQRRFAKVLSWILAALLVISLLPTSMLQVRAEEGETSNRAWEWTRLAGSNRYHTATLATQEVFEDGSCEKIIIASGQAFPDALSGSALAGALGCPILLTNTKKLTDETKAEIQRLAAPNCQVLILGGTGAVSEAAERAIKNLGIEGLTTKRVAGANRDETMRSVYAEGNFPAGGTIIVATGYSYADVLSISPYAYAAKAPIILTKKNGTLTPEAKALLENEAKPSNVIIIGGAGVVTEATENYLKGLSEGVQVMRLAGANRYATSAEIMKWELGLNAEAPFQPDVEMHIDGMGVATGTGFADALGATSLLGKIASPLLLVADNNKNNKAATQANIDELIAPYAADMTKGYIFGGTGAISAQIEGWLNEAVPEVEEKIYTVDEIREVMAGYTDKQVSEEEYVVRGVVTSSSYNSRYGSYTVWLENDDGSIPRAFQLYSVGMDSSITEDYTASNALLGKIVTCRGYLEMYGTTYEMPYFRENNDPPSPTGEEYRPLIINVEEGEEPPVFEDHVEDKEYTVDELLAAMENYPDGQVSGVECTVTGVASSSSYSSSNNNYTVWLKSDDGTKEQAFELFRAVLDESVTGTYTTTNAMKDMTVTCRGYVQKYVNSTGTVITFEMAPANDKAPTILKIEGEEPPAFEDHVEDKEYTVDGILEAMSNYPDGQVSGVECTVTGVATSSTYDEGHTSYTLWLQSDDGTNAQAFKLYSAQLGESIEGDWTAENAFAGKKVTCRGYAKRYGEEYELAYISATQSSPVILSVEDGEEPPVFEDLVEDKEYTVDELLEAMANYPADQVSGVECTVTGVASSSSYRSNFNSYNIWLKSDDGETNKAFYLYSVAIDESIEGDFTEANALAGKVVTCRGYVKFYNGDYEMPFLGAASSPTGEDYTPVVSKIEDGEEPPVFEDHVEDKEYSVDELLAAMENYPDGQVSAVECTVTGVATSSSYDSRYGSYTIWLQNNDGTVEQAFELYSAKLGEGIEGDYTAANAFAGKTVTCRGYVKLYGTTYEMAYISATQSSPMITKVEGGEEPPVFEDHVEDKEYTVDELLAAMENYPDGQVSAVECTVTGVATSSSYDSRYGSYTIWLQNNDGTVEQAFELYSAQLGEGIEGDWTATDAFKGCTVTCRGYVKLYGTTYEMAYISDKESSPIISSIVEPERDDQEKVDYEAGKLSLKETYTAAEVVTLPTPEKYEDVQIAWISDSQYAVIDETAGTLTITLPEEGTVTANVNATLSLGTATAAVPFVLTIKAPAVGGVTWTKVAFADIQDGDVIAITATYEGTTWAMSTTEVSSKNCPMGIVIEPSGNIFVTEDMAAFGFTAGSVGTGRSFQAYETERYLYCTNANDGVRVGTPQNSETIEFSMDQNFLFNVAQARYVGVYRINPDWRCYTSVNNNIKDETIEFWKGEASATPEPSEQEKVNYEAENLTLPEEISEAGALMLPTPKKYNDVQIAWVSDSELAVVDETAGTLTITLPEEDTTINVTATLSLGGASVPKNFAITIKAAGEEPETITWTKVAWEDILDGDTIAITATFGGKTYVLSTTETGKDGQPMGVVVEPVESVLETLGIDGYGFVVGTEEAGRNFEVYNKQNVYLHCVADNNGVRLGESEELAFTLTDGYLYHVGQGRFVGVYNRDLDWRCYTSIISNISGETIEFWKADLGGDEPPEMNDEEKVEFEASKLTFSETTFEEAKTVDLPVPLTYTDVTVAWVSDSEYAVIDETAGTLTITLPEQGVVTANVTATLSLKGATATANFELTIIGPAAGEEKKVTIVAADLGYANQQEVNTIPAEGVTITFDKASGDNAPKYYDSGAAIRTYASNTITFAVQEGAKIKGIKLTFVSSGYTGNCSYSSGEYQVTDAIGQWTGEAGSVTFTVDSTPKTQARFVSFEVTYME